jgi:hypothetical protein
MRGCFGTVGGSRRSEQQRFLIRGDVSWRGSILQQVWTVLDGGVKVMETHRKIVDRKARDIAIDN